MTFLSILVKAFHRVSSTDATNLIAILTRWIKYLVWYSDVLKILIIWGYVFDFRGLFLIFQ